MKVEITHGSHSAIVVAEDKLEAIELTMLECSRRNWDIDNCSCILMEDEASDKNYYRRNKNI